VKPPLPESPRWRSYPIVARRRADPAPTRAGGYFEREFGIDDALLPARAGPCPREGGDSPTCFFEHTIGNWVGLEDGKVNRAYGNVSLGVGIRTVKGDQVWLWFHARNSQRNHAGRRRAGRDHCPTAGARSRRASSWPRSWATVTDGVAVHAGPASKPSCRWSRRSTTAASARSPLIVKVNGMLHDEQKRLHLVVTSDGTKAEDLAALTYLAASVTAEENGRRNARPGPRRRRDFRLHLSPPPF